MRGALRSDFRNHWQRFSTATAPASHGARLSVSPLRGAAAAATARSSDRWAEPQLLCTQYCLCTCTSEHVHRTSANRGIPRRETQPSGSSSRGTVGGVDVDRPCTQFAHWLSLFLHTAAPLDKGRARLSELELALTSCIMHHALMGSTFYILESHYDTGRRGEMATEVHFFCIFDPPDKVHLLCLVDKVLIDREPVKSYF